MPDLASIPPYQWGLAGQIKRESPDWNYGNAVDLLFEAGNPTEGTFKAPVPRYGIPVSLRPIRKPIMDVVNPGEQKPEDVTSPGLSAYRSAIGAPAEGPTGLDVARQQANNPALAFLAANAPSVLAYYLRPQATATPRAISPAQSFDYSEPVPAYSNPVASYEPIYVDPGTTYSAPAYVAPISGTTPQPTTDYYTPLTYSRGPQR